MDSLINESLINEENIVDTIIQMMEKAEQFVDKTGIEKKAVVMTNLKTLLGTETYDRYKYLITGIIDFIVKVSKGKKINLNNIKKKFCCISI